MRETLRVCKFPLGLDLAKWTPPSLGKSHYFLCFGANFWDLVGSILGGPTHGKFGIESHVTIQNHERACSEGWFFSTLTLREREGLSRLQDANQACGHSKKVRCVLTCERSLAWKESRIWSDSQKLFQTQWGYGNCKTEQWCIHVSMSNLKEVF